MSTDERIQSLKDKHAELERKLEDEESRPLPDGVLLHQIKREKLAIKDELAALTH